TGTHDIDEHRRKAFKAHLGPTPKSEGDQRAGEAVACMLRVVAQDYEGRGFDGAKAPYEDLAKKAEADGFHAAYMSVLENGNASGLQERARDAVLLNMVDVAH